MRYRALTFQQFQERDSFCPQVALCERSLPRADHGFMVNYSTYCVRGEHGEDHRERL